MAVVGFTHRKLNCGGNQTLTLMRSHGPELPPPSLKVQFNQITKNTFEE